MWLKQNKMGIEQLACGFACRLLTKLRNVVFSSRNERRNPHFQDAHETSMSSHFIRNFVTL